MMAILNPFMIKYFLHIYNINIHCCLILSLYIVFHSAVIVIVVVWQT